MIVGIGVDIIEIERIGRAIERTGSFLQKVFTQKEIELFKSKSMKRETIAANFSAKEAVSKALGTGFRGFALKDIEVLRDELGKPVVYMHNNANTISSKLGVKKIHISISHNKSNVIVYVVLEG